MNSKQIILSAIGGLIVLASANVYAATLQTSDIVAREASEGPRGKDRVHTGTHKLGTDAAEYIIAREASEGPRGADNNNHRQRRGGRLSIENPGDLVIAREAAEGPRGGDNERPGDRQRRGGRNGLTTDDAGQFIIAREASEGPRGGDNERPGDRQRRGGRKA